MSAKSPIPAQAKWRELSGLTVEAEISLQGKDRRAAIRKLAAAAETEIRAELKLAEEDAEFKSERTFLWEPLSEACHRLEIAQSALTRFLKELTGMTASQLADKIRAEGVREKLKDELTEQIRTRLEKPGRYSRRTTFMDEFWAMIKTIRAKKSFSYAARAIQFGFANYTRMYRACLLQYGLTPQQLENEILEEIALFFRCALDLIRRKQALEDLNQDLPQYDVNRKPYCDLWAKAVECRLDWLNENMHIFGVQEQALEFV